MITKEEFNKHGFTSLSVKIGTIWHNSLGFVLFEDYEDKDLYHLRRFAIDQVDIATVKTMEEYQNAATDWLINYWEDTLKSLRERMEKGEEELKKLKDGTYWNDYLNNKQKMQDLIDGYLSGRN